MKIVLKKCFFIFFIFNFNYIKTNNKVDMVIYSFDRPLQLYALLESVEKYIKNLGEINIIYRVRYTAFNNAYDQVKHRFNKYTFHKQGENPHKDFAPLLFKCAFETRNDYVIFAVDDIIVKDNIDMLKCVETLKKTNAYGFYLRLGKNITYCYMMNINTPVPKHENVIDDIYIYKFKDGQGDWAYPNCNDMTIYKKKDIIKHFNIIPLRNTSYEGYWHQHADLTKEGLFFEESKIVNIPLNLTNEESTGNKNMKLYSSIELLRRFNKGYKFNINQFYKINNTSPHMEYVPEFINR